MKVKGDLSLNTLYSSPVSAQIIKIEIEIPEVPTRIYRKTVKKAAPKKVAKKAATKKKVAKKAAPKKKAAVKKKTVKKAAAKKAAKKKPRR